MGLEAATYINQLVVTNPVGATDPKGQGDDHLRLIKATLQNTFPNITGEVTATHTVLNNFTPTVFTFPAAIKQTGIITPAALAANQDNYSPAGLATASILRLSSSASVTITGIAAQPDGTVITLIQLNAAGGFNIGLSHENAGSVAANRILLAGGVANETIPFNSSMTLFYDGLSSRWRVIR